MISTDFMFGPVKCSTYGKQEFLAVVKELLTSPMDTPRTINCLNAHIFNLAWRDKRLTDTLNKSRIVTADGMSIVWASILFKKRLKERCNMTEVFRDFMRDSSFPQSRAVLIGGDIEVAKESADKINRLCSHIKVIDSMSGYLLEDAYKSYFQQCEQLDFVFLGLGTPKSEYLSELISVIQPQAIVWHIGGGTILFLADRLPEAPKWMRRAALQWLHRLLIEPKRMWRRYLLGNFSFVWRVLRCSVKNLLRDDQRITKD
jgi:N-acetylglucosaminyldiphosphoundecaprenol N-acetyl-beta-D-mannosaminyltransferase